MNSILRGFATAALFSPFVAPAMTCAADVSVSGFFSQRFELDSDLAFDPSASREPGANSVSNLGFLISGRSPRTSWTFAPGVNAILSTDSDFGATNVNPRFSGSLVHREPRLQLNAGLSVIPRLTNSSRVENQLGFDTPFDDPQAPPDDQFVFNEATALQVDVNGNLGARYTLDSLNSVSTSLFGRIRRYSGDNSDTFEPNQSYGATLGWSRRVDDRTTLNLSGRVQRFTENSDSDSSSDTGSLTVGFDRSVSPTLSFGADIGGTYATTEERVAAAGGGFVTEEDNRFGLTGGARLSWRGEDTRASLRISNAFDQNDTGGLENRTSISGSVGYDINSVSRLGVSAGVGFQNPLFSENDSDRVTLSIGPSYSYSMTRLWTASAGYRLRTQYEDGDTSLSNVLFLQVSRSISVLP